MVDRHSVVIVGAGPIGLTLANLLGLLGIDTLLIERNPHTVQEPRAVSIDDESLRTMQAIGLIDAVSKGTVPGYGSDYFTPNGRNFVTVEPKGTPYGYPRRNAFRQPALEAVLRDGLSRFDTVTVKFATTVQHFAQYPDHVLVDLIDEHGVPSQVEGDWLAGCDGASSSVREQLGIPLVGSTFDERWLIVDLTNSPARSANTHVFCDAGRPCIALPGPDLTRRFEFKLREGETDAEMRSAHKVAELLRAHGAHPDSVVARNVVYRFHARQAKRWSDRRVFLAGDAAHLTPPFAGQGMNSGIRDAMNLAWKLAAVVRSQASHRLLESYESERRDHVDAMIQLALRMGRIMAPSNPLVGWITQSAFLAMRAIPPVSRFFSEMKYKPKPRFTDGFLIPDDRSARTSAVGRLLPQPRVVTADGHTLLLDEIIGYRFALIGFGARSFAALDAATQGVWQRLDAVRLRIGMPGEDAASVDASLEESGIDDALRALLAAYPDHVFFLRPDHYVAAVARADQMASIAAAVAGQLD